jgi:DNA modification methylase
VIHTGDCVAVMAAMEPDSIDAICCDPPYGLEFMGRDWDRLYSGGNPTLHADGERFATLLPNEGVRRGSLPSSAGHKMPRCRNCGKYQHGNDAPGKGGIRCKCPVPDFDYRHAESGFQMQAWHERWATAALRVAKPGAYLLAFGGTRTVHRLTVALEDAGWIIRDLLVWAYASGFPKSKSSLKPAWEPIVLARKPGPLRELAIDECRIGTDGGTTRSHQADFQHEAVPGQVHATRGYRTGHDIVPVDGGRWPANVILTDPIFDGGWEGVVGGSDSRSSGFYEPKVRGPRTGAASIPLDNGPQYGDTGTYSRFFLIPKASRSDREPLTPGGLELGVTPVSVIAPPDRAVAGSTVNGKQASSPRRNTHPTVKPVELMRHLVRLVTPSGGTVLDPFLGSGSTAIAAEQEGFDWIGIEREAEYVAIAQQRLVDQQRGLGLTA